MRNTHYAHNLLCLSEGYLKIQMPDLISVKPYFQEPYSPLCQANRRA